MDNQENTAFTGASAGMDQPMPANGKDDVVIKVGGSGGKGWMIAAIISIVLAVGLAAGLAFVFLNLTDKEKKVDELQGSLDASEKLVGELRTATGVENPRDVVIKALGVEDFSKMKELLPESEKSASFASMTVNGEFQIVRLETTDGAESDAGRSAILYRVLPNGEWAYSENFSGDVKPNCGDLTAEEQKAFDGVMECAE